MRAPLVAAASEAPDTGRAVAELIDGLGGPDAQPGLVFVHGGAAHDPEQIRRAMRSTWPDVQIVGGSSCRGALSSATPSVSCGLAALGVERAGRRRFGVGSADKSEDPRAAARVALEAALLAARSEGEMPDLVWVVQAPGGEEAVLAGIADVVGAVPVLGGSSADDDVAGQWWQLDHEEIHRSGVVLAVLFWDGASSWSFHSGYVPTEAAAVVTRAEGRVLYELDGRPAAEVYGGWLDFDLGWRPGRELGVLHRTTLSPLGRRAASVGGVPFYSPVHPERVGADGRVHLFCDVEQGEMLHLMAGDRRSLVTRAGRVARYALEELETRRATPLGALVIYCGGCRLAVDGSLGEVDRGLQNALSGTPYIGAFTFGEQGCFLDGTSQHGNLMIATLVLAGDDHG